MASSCISSFIPCRTSSHSSPPGCSVLILSPQGEEARTSGLLYLLFPRLEPLLSRQPRVPCSLLKYSLSYKVLPKDPQCTNHLHPSMWGPTLTCFMWIHRDHHYWTHYLLSCSVAQSCPTACDPMDGSTPGLPVLHHLPESAQTHVH